MNKTTRRLMARMTERDARLQARWEELQAQRRCPGCGGPMPPSVGRGRPRRWCSDACRRTGGPAVNPREGLSCLQCGRPVTTKPVGRTPKWCSAVCRRAAYDQRRIQAAATELLRTAKATGQD